LEKQAGDIKDIAGVMPYLAPELFSGHGSYSQASDIYAFGMIMWEISSHEKPFHDIVHDKVLALRICKGLRPEITNDTPSWYRDLIQKCWHPDPKKRPNAKEIYDLTRTWDNKPTQEVVDQLEKAEENRQRNIGIKKETKTSHPGAIYSSRLLTNITKGSKFYCYYFVYKS